MRRLSACLAVTAAVLCCGTGLRAETIPPKPVEGKIAWVYSYEEGKKEAGRSGKPVFVVFRCER